MNFNKFLPVPQILAHADQYPQTASSSDDRVSHVSSIQGFASGAFPTVPLQSSAFPLHGAYGPSPAFLCQPPMNGSYCAQASSSSLVVRSSQTAASLTGHPYSQSRPHRAAADYVPHYHHVSGPYVQQFVPAQGWDPDTHTSLMVPGARQTHPQSLTDSITIPMSAPVSHIPTQPAFSPVDHADVAYALSRYGNTPCFYQCRYDLYGSPCGKCIVGDRRRILRHLRNYHHLQSGPAACQWEDCTHPRQMRQENLSRHIVTHLGVKWRCPHCRLLFSRDDAVHRHIERVHPGVVVPEVDVAPGRDARSLSEL